MSKTPNKLPSVDAALPLLVHIVHHLRGTAEARKLASLDMGAAIQVFLQDSKVPTVGDWNAAIKAEAFDLVLNPFDLRADDGYRPAFLKGEESGFEWYLSQVATMAEMPERPAKPLIGNCDLRAQLCFTSYANEEAASAIAGAVLAKLSGGYYWDPETDDRFLQGDDAVAAARKIALERGSSPARK
jgi:hypothetical protein